MASINLQDGEQARLTITKEQGVEISKLYRQVYLDLKKQMGSLPLQGEGTASQSLKKTYLNKLIKQLKEEYKALGGELEEQIKKNMQDTASTVVQANADWLKKAGLTIEGAYSYVPKDIVALLSTGKLYGGGWTLSKAIWGESQKHAHDIDKIVAAGVAGNKSAYEIAKDLEKYVNPSAKKEWDWSKVYPGTSKKVDYNAQRLARTMVSHAYQQSLLATTKYNPFVTGYRWRSAHTHRTCELCNERDGQVYSAKNLPLDHPNGMCTFLVEFEGSLEDVANRLGDWANGAEDPELDRWFKDMYPTWDSRRDTPSKSTPVGGGLKYGDSVSPYQRELVERVQKGFKSSFGVYSKVDTIESRVEDFEGLLSGALAYVVPDSPNVLHLNPKFFINEDSFYSILGGKIGAYHKNATPESIIAHEMAHSLEGQIDLSDTLSKAFSEYLSKNPKSGMDQYLPDYQYVGESISHYAVTTEHETMAEAFGDVYANGEKASEASKLIVGEVLKRL